VQNGASSYGPILKFAVLPTARSKYYFYMRSCTDEHLLIESAKAGRSAAIEELFHVYYKPLLEYIKRHSPHTLVLTVEPQDILQDTWLRAVRGIPTFQSGGDSDFYRWLATIARNVIADKLRHLLVRKRSGELDPDDAQVGKLLEDLAFYMRTPSASARSHELMASVKCALARLPEEQSTPLRLRYMESWDIDRIASVLNRSRGSVMMLCNRALKAMRLELQSFEK
jgi:RNA polymerase sigma factor (sigma-70 family)